MSFLIAGARSSSFFTGASTNDSLERFCKLEGVLRECSVAGKV
jgi:hypothetical protein